MMYIGQRKCPENKTPETDSYLGSGKRLKVAISKYGKSNFMKNIIDTCESQSSADRLEAFYFDEYDIFGKNKDSYYNIAPAGHIERPDDFPDFMRGIYSNHEFIKKFKERMSKRVWNVSTANDLVDLSKARSKIKHPLKKYLWKVGLGAASLPTPYKSYARGIIANDYVTFERYKIACDEIVGYFSNNHGININSNELYAYFSMCNRMKHVNKR